MRFWDEFVAFKWCLHFSSSLERAHELPAGLKLVHVYQVLQKPRINFEEGFYDHLKEHFCTKRPFGPRQAWPCGLKEIGFELSDVVKPVELILYTGRINQPLQAWNMKDGKALFTTNWERGQSDLMLISTDLTRIVCMPVSNDCTFKFLHHIQWINDQLILCTYLELGEVAIFNLLW